MTNYTFAAIFGAIFCLTACKKKYERPDEYEIDLFKNERKVDNPTELLSAEEALKIAEVVIIVDSLKLLDHSTINKLNQIYVYQISSAKVEKGNSDSILFPMNILSTKEIKLSKNNHPRLYLENLKSYKLLVQDFKIKYQVIDKTP